MHRGSITIKIFVPAWLMLENWTQMVSPWLLGAFQRDHFFPKLGFSYWTSRNRLRDALLICVAFQSFPHRAYVMCLNEMRGVHGVGGGGIVLGHLLVRGVVFKHTLRWFATTRVLQLGQVGLRDDGVLKKRHSRSVRDARREG